MLNAKANKAGNIFTSNFLDKCVTQVKKMFTMINGLLNVSRLEAGKLSIDLKHFDMSPLMKEVKEEIDVIVKSHYIIFAPIEESFVTAYRDEIMSVVNNLISNAVKYSPEDSTINVACVAIENNVLVSVSDRGVGIISQDINKYLSDIIEQNQPQKVQLQALELGYIYLLK